MSDLRLLLVSICACAVLGGCSSYGSADDDPPRIYRDGKIIEAQEDGSFTTSTQAEEEFEPVELQQPDEYESYAEEVTDSAVQVHSFTKPGSDAHKRTITHHPEPLADSEVPSYSSGSVDVFMPWLVNETKNRATALDDVQGNLEDLKPADRVGPLTLRKPTERIEVLYKTPSDRAAKVYFGHGQKQVDDKGDRVLTKLSDAVGDQRHPIEVTGYASERADITDPVDRKIANLKTSLDRAFEVSKTLIKKGVPAENIKTSAWGEAKKAQSSGTMSTEEASRRVEITSRLSQ